MSKYIALNMVELGNYRFDEEAGREVRDEGSKPTLVNADHIRCLYARRDGKPGSRITFADGGGFAVTEAPDHIAGLIAGGDTSVRLALSPPVSETAN
jgi:hypothetical protein